MQHRLFFPAFLALLLSASLPAQDAVTAAEQAAVVDSLSRQLRESYVFPAVADEMADLLVRKQADGQYRSLTDVHSFANQLTEDLQSISHDKHLRVLFNPDMAQHMRRPPADDEDEEDQGPPPAMLRNMQRDNYGFREVKILEGNVGYLDLRSFTAPAYAGEAAAAAMNLLAGADALIFDLRRNGGGSPGMIQLLTSYLYPEGAAVHLNSFYYRPSDDTSQTWTLPYVPGRRNPRAQVYVLTSPYTFSAAEEFTYNLKNLERGTIVGETTGGGAHPGGTSPLTERFLVWIPSGRAINPVTGANWEGTGVSPHVAVPAEEALDQAHLLALDSLAAKARTEDDRRYYDWYADALRARLQPVTIPAATLQQYAGNYGPRSLIYDDGRLYYQRSGRPRLALTALADDTFAPAGMPDFRLQVEQQDGRPVALRALYDNGRTERHARTDTQP